MEEHADHYASLKVGLVQKHDIAELKDNMGHSLKKLWRAFKSDFPDSGLERHDKTVSGLDKFEDIRYPGAALRLRAPVYRQ
jgi:hypothetical protein